MKISQIKKKQGKYCCAYHCRNEPIKKKGGLCHKHYARLIKERDPVYARWRNFKSKNRQRAKQFPERAHCFEVKISLQEFREFCQRTGYIIVKGRRGYNATIERPDPTMGYSKNNMELLKHRENSAKGATLDKLIIQAMESDEEIPF